MFYRISLSLLASMCLPAVLSATTYNCPTYSVPGASNTYIGGINNSGIVVGAYRVNGISSPTHGFIADPSSGNFQTFDYPGAAYTELFTINNNGVTFGRSFGGQLTEVVFFTLDANGNFSPVTAPEPFTIRYAGGINDEGNISVIVQDHPSGVTSVNILNPDGTLTPVATGSLDTVGSINSALQMMEVGSLGGTWLADAAGNLTVVNAPAGSRTWGYGLNNYGMVVGYTSSNPFGPYLGFSRDPSGAYSEVLCPGVHNFANPIWVAVNDNGVVAGGNYIATPIPGDPEVTLSATELTFQTYGDPQDVTLTNTGDARLDIAGIRSSSTSSPFQVSGCVDPTTQTASLDPGATCTLRVTPSSPGTGTIFIDDSAAGAPHSIAVSVSQ